MKIRHALIPFAVLAVVGAASAQTTIFRCGNTYTNDAKEAQAKGCKAVEGGNVTVVQGTKVNPALARPAPMASQGSGSRDQKVDSSEQKARDSEARSILEAELKKAEAKLADLRREYNNGEPEKQGPEHKNYQKYLDRVNELKAAIERAEQDVAGLKRELSRTSANGAGSAAAK
jgi:hypothetical protein